MKMRDYLETTSDSSSSSSSTAPSSDRFYFGGKMNGRGGLSLKTLGIGMSNCTVTHKSSPSSKQSNQSVLLETSYSSELSSHSPCYCSRICWRGTHSTTITRSYWSSACLLHLSRLVSTRLQWFDRDSMVTQTTVKWHLTSDSVVGTWVWTLKVEACGSVVSEELITKGHDPLNTSQR